MLHVCKTLVSHSVEFTYAIISLARVGGHVVASRVWKREFPPLCLAFNLVDNTASRLLATLVGDYWQTVPFPVVAPSKALVCGRSLAGIAGSNSGRGMDACLF